MDNLIGFDFKQHLIVDYNTSSNCKEKGCEEDEICRCTRINNAKVTDAVFYRISDVIYRFYFDRSKSSSRNIKINEILYGVNEEIDRYTIDRILRVNKIWTDEPWIIEISEGYYGQEIDVVMFKEDVAIRIQNQIELALSILEINKRVEFLLELEYDKLLPSLDNCNWKLIRLKKDDITFPSRSHLENVQKKELAHYYFPKYNSIRSIVVKDGDKWRLIDGYHRLSAIQLGDFFVLAGSKSI